MRVLILKGHTRALTCVTYNLDGDLLFSCAKDDCPTLWRVSDGQRIGTYTDNGKGGHNGTVWWLSVNSNATRLLTAGADQTCRLWDVATGDLLATFELTGPVRHVEWAEGDDMFLALSDSFMTAPPTLWLFRRSGNGDGDDEASWTKQDWKITGLAPGKKFSRATWAPLNETIITGDETGVIRIHNVETGEVLREVSDLHSKRINCFSWNSEKTLLITGSADHSSKLLDPFTLRCLRVFETEVPVNSVAISPLKEHCFVAGGQEAMAVTTTSTRVGKFETKIFHTVFGDEIGCVRGHFGPVNTISIHPDGTGFTSGSEDGYIRLHEFDPSYFLMHREYDDLSELVNIAGGSSSGPISSHS